MNKIKLEYVPASTAILIKSLSSVSRSSDFILCGGTAIALQIGHRISHDVDLFVIGEKLHRSTLKLFINELSQQFKVDPVPFDPLTALEFEDAGMDISDYHQNFSVITSEGPVKLSIAAADKNSDLLVDAKILTYGSLDIADIETLFKLKASTVTERHKKRDLFDIASLLNINIGSFDNLMEIAMEKSGAHYEHILLNKLISWPATDEDDIHFLNGNEDKVIIERDTIDTLKRHLQDWESIRVKKGSAISDKVTAYRERNSVPEGKDDLTR